MAEYGDPAEYEDPEELGAVTKRYFEEYDVELFFADKGTTGTLAVLERGEKAFIEWTPFESYDVNLHMSFDEWGVIAHDATQQEAISGIPPLRISVSAVK